MPKKLLADVQKKFTLMSYYKIHLICIGISQYGEKFNLLAVHHQTGLFFKTGYDRYISYQIKWLFNDAFSYQLLVRKMLVTPCPGVREN